MAARRHPSSAVLEPRLAGVARVDALDRQATTWRTEATARRALALAVGAALALVAVVAAAPQTFMRQPEDGFPLWMVGPFRFLGRLLPSDGLFVSVAFSALVAAMFVAYALALACARHVPVRWGVGAIVALHVIILLGPPLALSDVFNYLSFSRLGIVHGVNPYLAAPAQVPVDPSFEYASWRHGLSPYGPLFTVASYPLAALPVPVAHWVLKVLTAVASLGCLALVWRIAQRLGRPPLPAVLLVGLNPLVLVYGLGGVHNDFFMIALVLAAVAAFVAGRCGSAGAAMSAAAGIKLTGGLLLPYMLVRARRRGELITGAVAAGAAVAALSLAGFGLHPPAVGIQSRFVTPLSAPNLLGLVLGQGGATPFVRALVQVALIAVLAWLAVRALRGADWLKTGGWATVALILSLSWEMPWYVLWVLPLAALADSRRLRHAALALSVFLFIGLAPISGYLLGLCHCSPIYTDTGKRNDAYILQFLR